MNQEEIKQMRYEWREAFKHLAAVCWHIRQQRNCETINEWFYHFDEISKWVDKSEVLMEQMGNRINAS